MIYTSNLTYEQCLNELANSIHEKLLHGYIKRTKQKKYSRASFLLAKKSLKVAMLRLPIQVYVFGKIIKTKSGTEVKLKIRYGLSSFFEFLILLFVLYAILLYSSKSYYEIPYELLFLMTIIVMGFIITASYLFSKYSNIAKSQKADILDFIKRILKLYEQNSN